MQAVRVKRLSDTDHAIRYYLDGKRVSASAWGNAHTGKRTDLHSSRIFSRKDGSEIVREYHYIRSN